MEDTSPALVERIYGQIFWENTLHYYAKVEGTEELK